MKIIKYLLSALCVFFAVPTWADANLTVVSGAGYKKPVTKLIELYRATGGQAVDASFGNMQQIIAQTQASSSVALMFGDEKYLQKLPFLSNFQTLGVGKLVVAWPIGKAPIAADADLSAPGIGRIALPDAEKAIYGLAATEWMKSRGIHEALQTKLITAATVPQVTSYLVAGEVDAGFINVTDAIGVADKIGGYRLLEDGYTPIRIVVGTVKGHENNPGVRGFLEFLRSDRALEVLRSFGM